MSVAALRDRLANWTPDQAPSGPTGAFPQAGVSFGVILKAASHLSNGNMRVMIEIPNAHTKAFFLATQKAFDIELVCTLSRKPTQAD